MPQTISYSQSELTRKRTEEVIERLFPMPRPFSIRLWDGSELTAVGQPVFTLALKHPGALRRMFSPPIELSLGEAFIRDDYDIEGDIFSTFTIMRLIT